MIFINNLMEITKNRDLSKPDQGEAPDVLYNRNKAISKLVMLIS